MEDKKNPTLAFFGGEEVEEEEFADNLSFCDLQIGKGNDDNSLQQSPRTSSAQETLFEFFSGLSSESFSSPNIIFCGKIIHEDEEEKELNEYQKRDYLTVFRSSSFHRQEINLSPMTKNRSTSFRYPNSHAQKVNITSLTSMSAKSKRRMFMFGPVKFKPEMELSAIKQRQCRRAPVTKSPAPVAAGREVALRGGVGGGKGGSHWGLLRSLKVRAHLTTVLARSFGCLPVAGVERALCVAN